MFVAIDIGNSDIVAAIRFEERWKYTWRTPSNIQVTSEDYESKLRDFFLENEIEITSLKGIMISSVVPDLTDVIARMCARFFGCEPIVLTPNIMANLPMKVNSPHEIGADLVCNAFGAFQQVGGSVIVVDFGTALTFTSVATHGEILGVAIAPGVKTAMKSLSSNTAKLPEIPLEIPDKVIGTDTVSALQAGIMQGYAGLVSHLIDKTKEEMQSDPYVIATGGLSFIFQPLSKRINEVNPLLTLDGLYAIYEYLVSQEE